MNIYLKHKNHQKVKKYNETIKKTRKNIRNTFLFCVRFQIVLSLFLLFLFFCCISCDSLDDNLAGSQSHSQCQTVAAADRQEQCQTVLAADRQERQTVLAADRQERRLGWEPRAFGLTLVAQVAMLAARLAEEGRDFQLERLRKVAIFN